VACVAGEYKVGPAVLDASFVQKAPSTGDPLVDNKNTSLDTTLRGYLDQISTAEEFNELDDALLKLFTRFEKAPVCVLDNRLDNYVVKQAAGNVEVRRRGASANSSRELLKQERLQNCIWRQQASNMV
jgi:hypothetical protein